MLINGVLWYVAACVALLPLPCLQDVCNATFVVDTTYGLWGYKVVRTPKSQHKSVVDAAQQYVASNEKYELGTTASSTLRAPKASSTRAAANSANAGRAHVGSLWSLFSMSCVALLWMCL